MMPKKKKRLRIEYSFIPLIVLTLFGFFISLTPGITGYSIFESGNSFNLVFLANFLAVILIFGIIFYPSDQPISIANKEQKKKK